MILDTLPNCEKYFSLHENFAVAFGLLKEFYKNPLPVGKYEIIGEDIYALVQDYNPKKEARFESHKDFIDVTYISYGNEKIKHVAVSKCHIEEDQTPKKDMIFYTYEACLNEIIAQQNDFVVFFPNDAHAPGLKHSAEMVKKVVVKVRI